jgi:methylmalonyl-CoA mutase
VQDTERHGGLVAALNDELIHTEIADAVLARAAHVAKRTRPLTGVTEFPDLTETRRAPTAAPTEAAGTPFPPLVPVRLADEVEALRLAADSTAERPAVYLATLGPEAVFTPRLTFAQNFFGVGGIETPSGEVSAFDSARTPVACLCSSDAVYRDGAAAAAGQLRTAGATTVLLAGRGLGVEAVDGEIGLGSDVLATLTDLLRQLGVGEEGSS